MQQIVVKTVKNHKNNILWQALYIDSSKMIENFTLDITKLKKAFNIENETIINLIVHENNITKISEIFSNYDDFKQLNINEEYELNKNDIIWIPDYNNNNYIIKSGKVTVKEIFNAPISNIIWDPEYLKKTVTWFSCKEVEGLFCWTKIVKMQNYLKNKVNDRTAIIISNKIK
jgi:hypothetical protein